jgi:hypothetical protein
VQLFTDFKRNSSNADQEELLFIFLTAITEKVFRHQRSSNQDPERAKQTRGRKKQMTTERKVIAGITSL